MKKKSIPPFSPANNGIQAADNRGYLLFFSAGKGIFTPPKTSVRLLCSFHKKHKNACFRFIFL
jgi:hypothetical protein